jgi:hypothetical protein
MATPAEINITDEEQTSTTKFVAINRRQFTDRSYGTKQSRLFELYDPKYSETKKKGMSIMEINLGRAHNVSHFWRARSVTVLKTLKSSVISRRTFYATHTVSFLGILATGLQSIMIDYNAISRYLIDMVSIVILVQSIVLESNSTVMICLVVYEIRQDLLNSDIS